MKPARGFTLLEVLLATSLTAVVGLSIASVLGTMHKAQERVRERSGRRAFLRALERRIGADLRGVVPPGGLHAAGLVGESQTRGGNSEELLPADLLQRAASKTKPTGEPYPLEERDRLTLAVLPPTRAFGLATPLGQGALWQVVYEIDDDPETEERGLVRRVTRVRDPAVGSEEEPPEQLAEEVVAMNVTFFDGQEWAETWDSGASDTLPQAISVELVVLFGEDVILYRILVAPLTARPSQLKEATQ